VSVPVDVEKIRAEAESWLKTYATEPRPTPSAAWPWLNGRCHPSIVLALCERIAELDRRDLISSADGEVYTAFMSEADTLISKADLRVRYAIDACTRLGIEPAELAVSEMWLVHEKDGKGGTRWVPEERSMGAAMRLGSMRTLKLAFTRKNAEAAHA